MNVKKSEASIYWLSLKEAATLIGISPRQLAQLAEEGEIAYKREGHAGRKGMGKFLFSKCDVDTYNARKRIPARFEREAPKTPTMRTRIYVDPDDCGSSGE